MLTQPRPAIHYPSSDGKRMADNTLQFRWIVTIEGGLEALFRDDPNVFVAGDLLWYPVQDMSGISAAPDVMVVFGRPKGDRTSYVQHEEDQQPPQVVFEILSDSNSLLEMLDKQDFYEEHGVQEYYLYDPRTNVLRGWYSDGAIFRKIHKPNGWVSPLLKIRFTLEKELVIYGPDGKAFLPYTELLAERNRESQRADQAEKQNEQLRAKLRAAGLDPDA